MAKLMILLTKEDITTQQNGYHVNILTNVCDINLSTDAIDELITDLQEHKKNIEQLIKDDNRNSITIENDKTTIYENGIKTGQQG